MSGPQQAGPQQAQQPSPQQLQQIQQQLAAEAAKRGMTVPQYVEQLKAQALRQHQAQQAAAAQGQQQKQGQQQVAVTPGPPKPEAIAVAKFLRSQPLKMRTCVFQEKRKDMFKGEWLCGWQIDVTISTQVMEICHYHYLNQHRIYR